MINESWKNALLFHHQNWTIKENKIAEVSFSCGGGCILLFTRNLLERKQVLLFSSFVVISSEFIGFTAPDPFSGNLINMAAAKMRKVLFPSKSPGFLTRAIKGIRNTEIHNLQKQLCVRFISFWLLRAEKFVFLLACAVSVFKQQNICERLISSRFQLVKASGLIQHR